MFFRYLIICLAIVLQYAFSVPVPEPSGWGGTHEHHVIHVPLHVHNIHHIHKVPVYIKSKPIIITKSHGWDWPSSSGWDWD